VAADVAISLSNEQSNPVFRFAISATFTAEPLRPGILFWGTQLKTDFQVRFAPYNQLLQTLLDPHSTFGRNTHGVNVLLARLGDFAQGAFADTARVEANAMALIEQARASTAHLAAPVLFCLCPPTPGRVDTDFANRLRRRMDTALGETPGVHFIDWCDVDRWYPVEVVHNPEGDRLGNIPYTELYYAALATALVRYTHALMRPPHKVIALDCDNTLWEGICGEDGPEGVRLDPARRVLHEAMLEQREAGMLLTMASKNNEADVLETFAAHPEMPLQPRHFVSWRLNWDPKAENLAQLAEELSLGLDSFIFIDDNAKECAELQQAIPDVLTIALPENIEDTPRLLHHVWAFDHPVITEEDRQRNTYYAQAQEFTTQSRRAASLEDFMATLDLRLTIAELSDERVARAAQLTHRTNQFNLTTIRRSEADIRSLGGQCFTVEVSDRFGEYGVVGLLIAKPSGDALEVDTFLLSCRALGRGVEHRMLAFLGERAAELGLHSVVLRYERTAKNSPARQFLESIDIGRRVDTANGFALHLPAGQTADFKWRPSPMARPPRPRHAATPARIVLRPDYGHIAGALATAESILEAIRSQPGAIEPEQGMTEVETRLARIWAELLERPSISRSDNFFDIGGHSLVAVLLLLRIRDMFGVELSIDDVYSGTLTLAELAARIEAAQLGNIDPDEYAALLAEIDSLSDDEARELLAKEQSGQG
jgi:FkbH-like protein